MPAVGGQIIRHALPRRPGFSGEGTNPKHDSVSPGPGAAMVDARDKLSAIRQRMEDAEKRYRNKEDGFPRFWGIWQKPGEKYGK